eukprot:5861654-Prymnesium_polylepis.2
MRRHQEQLRHDLRVRRCKARSHLSTPGLAPQDDGWAIGKELEQQAFGRSLAKPEQGVAHDGRVAHDSSQMEGWRRLSVGVQIQE